MNLRERVAGASRICMRSDVGNQLYAFARPPVHFAEQVDLGVQDALSEASDRARGYQASPAEPGGRSPFNNATTSDCRL